MSARYTKTITDLKKKKKKKRRKKRRYILLFAVAKANIRISASSFLFFVYFFVFLITTEALKYVSFLFFVLTMGRLTLFGCGECLLTQMQQTQKTGGGGGGGGGNNSKTISRRFISLDTASEFRLVEFSREVYRVIGSWPSRNWER